MNYKFTFEGERYRIKIVEHNIDNVDRFDFELFMIGDPYALDSGIGYTSVENAIQECKSQYFGIDY